MQLDLFSEEYPNKKPASNLPIIKKGKVKLTPVQSEFNRLNKKISLLKEELTNLLEKKRIVAEFYNNSVLPIMKELDGLLASAIAKLDVVYDKNELPAKDLFVLSSIIFEKSCDLCHTSRSIEEDEKKILVDLIRKHEMIQTGLSAKEMDKQRVSELLFMFTAMSGFKPTAKMKKAKTEEALTDLINEFLEDKTWEEPESQRTTSNKQEPKRKMTQTELKRKLQEEQTMKSIRAIYMELVKELHPDREQDEALRVVKEEQMKQLTEAYKNKDLSALLTMQISCLQESIKNTPDQLSDVLLKGYNKVLKRQLRKLEEEQQMIVYSNMNMPEEMFELLLAPINELDSLLKHHLKIEQLALKEVKSTCKSWCTKTGLKRLIKDHLHENECDDMSDSEMIDDLMKDFVSLMMSGKMKL